MSLKTDYRVVQRTAATPDWSFTTLHCRPHHAALAAAVLTLVVSHTVGGKDQTQLTRLRARLTGQAIQGATPEGGADFRSETGRTRLEVEVARVNLPAGAVLAVFLQRGANAPVQIGQIKISATGFGELELDSEHGAMVPESKTAIF